METQTAFGLGMLVVIVIGMIIAVVIGMFKLSHLEAELADTQSSTHKYLENIERYLLEIRKELENRIDQTQSIMDSRFDKFENKITKKQILKD
jgi:uncharacterized membrane-anchored protein YhcB (DUF1043 family)